MEDLAVKYRLPADKMRHCGCASIEAACTRFRESRVNPWSGRTLNPELSPRFNQVARYCTSQGHAVAEVALRKRAAKGAPAGEQPPPKKRTRKSAKSATGAAAAKVQTEEGGAEPAKIAQADVALVLNFAEVAAAAAATSSQAREAEIAAQAATAAAALKVQKRQAVLEKFVRLAKRAKLAAGWVEALSRARSAVEAAKKEEERAAIEAAKQKAQANAAMDIADAAMDVGSEAAAPAANPKALAEAKAEIKQAEKLEKQAEKAEEKVEDALIFKTGDFGTGKNKWTLQVRESTIVGAGRGLFTMHNIPKGAIICPYFGEGMKLISTAEFQTAPKTGYAFQPAAGWAMDLDGVENMHLKPFGIFANNCAQCASKTNNAKITPSKKGGGNWWANLVATKNIKAGEEIFASYGPSMTYLSGLPNAFKHLPTNSDLSCHIDAFIAGVLASVMAAPEVFREILTGQTTGSFLASGDITVSPDSISAQRNAVFADFIRMLNTPEVPVQVINKARSGLRGAIQKEQAKEEGAIDQWVSYFRDMFKSIITYTGQCQEHVNRVNTLEVTNHAGVSRTSNPMQSLSEVVLNLTSAALCKFPLGKVKGSGGLVEVCQKELSELVVAFKQLPNIMHIVGGLGQTFAVTAGRSSQPLDAAVDYNSEEGMTATTYKLTAIFKHTPGHWTAYIRSGDSWWYYNDASDKKLKSVNVGDVMQGDSVFFTKGAQ